MDAAHWDYAKNGFDAAFAETPAHRLASCVDALSGAFSLPKKPNYNFEKNRREQKKAAKMEAKREEKLRRKAEAERNANPQYEQDPQPLPE